MPSETHTRPAQSSIPGTFPETPPIGSASPERQARQSPNPRDDPDALHTARTLASAFTTSAFAMAPSSTSIPQAPSRLPRAVNGVGVKPHLNGLGAPTLTKPRAVTASSSQVRAAGTKKAAGTEPSQRAVSGGSIQERIRQIEQAAANSSAAGHAAHQNDSRTRTPSLSDGSGARTSSEQSRQVGSAAPVRAATLQKRPSPAAAAAPARKAASRPSPTPKSRPSPSSPVGRQPLFGEVITVTGGQVGHGIPPTYAKRSASESNISSPIAAEDRADAGAASSQSFDASLPLASARGRSQSENATSPNPHGADPPVPSQDRLSGLRLPSTTFGQDSKPPAAMSNAKGVRRHSASAEHLPSLTYQQPGSGSAQPASRQRYLRSAQPPPTSSHAVSAVIKEVNSTSPTSPRLRSSRPRVPVSSASTAASRARTQEGASAGGSRSPSPASRPMPSRERKPRTKSMLRAAEEARTKSRSRTRKANYAATDSSGSHSRAASVEGSRPATANHEARPRPGPEALRDTAVDPAAEARLSNGSDPAEDSPILGRTVYQAPEGGAGQNHDRIADGALSEVAPQRQFLSPILASPNPSEPQATGGQLAESADAQEDSARFRRPDGAAEGGVLHQLAMRMREDSMLEPSSDASLMDMFGGPSEGTINVAFRHTPILESAPGVWDPSGPPLLRFSTPNPDELTEPDDHGTPSAFNADDSISTILGPRSSQNETPVVPQAGTPGARFTLDSYSREEVNKILDFYNSHLISASQKLEFQEQLAAITPALAQDEETWSEHWAEPKATRLFLRKILDDSDENVRRLREEGDAAMPFGGGYAGEAHLQPPGSATSARYPLGGTPDSYQSPGTAFVQLGPSIPDKDVRTAQQAYGGHFSTARGDPQPRVAEAHRPPPLQSQPQGGALTGLGLGLSSPGQPPKLPEVVGAGEGLGLALTGSQMRTFPSDPNLTRAPSAPSHAPPPPPPPPSSQHGQRTIPSYALNPPPPLPLTGSAQNASLEAPLSLNQSSLRRSPETMRGKRRSRNLGSDGSVSTTRLSIGSPTHVAGFVETPRRSHSSNSMDDADTLAETNSTTPLVDAVKGAALSTPTLVDTTSSENAKRLTMRRFIIRELLDTEHAYNQDMVILEDIYKGTAQGILEKADVRILFGNLDMVRALSTKFLDAMKKACAPVYTLPKTARWNAKQGSFSAPEANGDAASGAAEGVEQSFSDRSEDEREALDRETFVGKVFRDHVDELEAVYKDFLKNQSAAHARLHELQREPSIKLWLEECSKYAKDLTSAWDLDSMLVKPLQRLTKYPLLLKQLRESTPAAHPDSEDLRLAFAEMDAALLKINEKTRRQEVIQTIIRGPASSVKDKERKKFPKLLAGKTSKMQQYVGTINVAEDKEYDTIVQKFGGHFFQLQVVMRDVERYCEDVVAYVNWYIGYVTTLGELLDLKPLGANGDLSQIESKWIAFGQAIKSIANTGLERHVREVRAHVIDPIVQLWRMHELPQKMMQKRKKRLPEYAKFRDMVDRNQKPDKRAQEAAEQFDAINDTLKEELPRLYTLTRKLIEKCLQQFVILQTRWQESWTKQISRMDRSLEQQEPIDSILHDFRAHYEFVLEEANKFSLINGEARAALSFLSPATTHSAVGDDAFSQKRPSTHTSRSAASAVDQNSLSSPDHFAGTHRHSGSFHGHSPVGNLFPTPSEQYHASRSRTKSEVSSRGPSTPKSAALATPPISMSHPPLPTPRENPNAIKPGAEEQFYAGARPAGSRPRSGTYFYVPEPGYYGTMPASPPPKPITPGSPGAPPSSAGYVSPSSFLASSPQRLRDQRSHYPAELDALDRISARSRTHRSANHQRGQSDFARDFYHGPAVEGERDGGGRTKVFSSAMPMDDGDKQPQPAPETDDSDLEVLFLAASLFEFRIDPNRMEAGYPYLRYAPGEVFDVVGVKGELWLARNQDDSRRTIGWIWEKHFARILDA